MMTIADGQTSGGAARAIAKAMSGCWPRRGIGPPPWLTKSVGSMV